MLTEHRADLHIHSCLSPCGDWEMSPAKIVRQSLSRGLDVIALCDHNSAENAPAVIEEGRRRGLAVLPGMEVCTREEVHILAIFERLQDALAMQAVIYAHLSEQNQPEIFGHQVVADAEDMVIGENQRLLIGATGLDLYQVVRHTHALGGLSIASHVDRQAFSIVGQLGFVPPDLALDAIEVSRRGNPSEVRRRNPELGRFTVVRSSDAHYLRDIGAARTVFAIERPTVAEIRLALKGECGRGVVG